MDRFCLGDCVRWITTRSLQRIAIQFAPEDLPDSPRVCQELTRLTSAEHEFFVVLTASCGVDFLAPLRLGSDFFQGIIAFGSAVGSLCLAPDTPFAKLPVLYVFGDRYDGEDLAFARQQPVLQDCDVLFYDLSHAALVARLIQDGAISQSKAAKITRSSDQWTFSSNVASLVTSESADSGRVFGHFSLPSGVTQPQSVTWLGTCNNLFFKTCGWNIKGIDPASRSEWSSVSHRELTKRLALIEKVKSSKTIGILFTNMLPSVDETVARVKQLLKKKGKNMILISVVQSADNTKFGNFPEVDVYALSSACDCGSLILKTKTHVPLISLTELEIALGVRRMYGGLEWNAEPEPETDESPEVGADQASVNEIRDIMELKDCMRSNWFGLEVAAGDREVTAAEEGLMGIASGYSSERRSDPL